MEVVKPITNFFGSALDELKRRINSPLAGTFLLAWLVVNWDFVYYFLFSEAKVETKISHINNYFLSLHDTFFMPVYLTIAYIGVYPLITSLSDAVWIFMDRLGKKIASFFLEKYSVITKEEQAILYRQMRQKEEEYAEKIAELEKANDALYSSVNALSIETDEENNQPQGAESLSGEKIQNGNVDSNKLNKSKVYFKKRAIERKRFFDTTDGDYFLTDLISKEMHFDKDDKYDSNELLLIKLIFMNTLESNPEPWYVKGLEARRDGRVITFAGDHVKAITNRLIRKELLEEANTERLSVLPSLAFLEKLDMHLNSFNTTK